MMMLNAGCRLNMTFGCQYQGHINFDVYIRDWRGAGFTRRPAGRALAYFCGAGAGL